MAGYSLDFSMSNNAIDAYDDGVRPLSKWDLEYLREAGWQETRKLALHLAAAGFWESHEWHHSGGTWFNEVKFYDAKILVDLWEDLTEEERQQHRDASKRGQDAPQEKRVRGHYTLWGGTRRHPTKVGQQEFTGALKGNWIHVDGGGRKKASGNHIFWTAIEED